MRGKKTELPTIARDFGRPVAKKTNCRRFFEYELYSHIFKQRRHLREQNPQEPEFRAVEKESSDIRKKWQPDAANGRNRRIFEKNDSTSPLSRGLSVKDI